MQAGATTNDMPRRSFQLHETKIGDKRLFPEANAIVSKLTPFARDNKASTGTKKNPADHTSAKRRGRNREEAKAGEMIMNNA